MPSRSAAPNCFRCRHFQITWERERGYACRAMGFKSGRMPWRVVLMTSGGPCLMFEAKPPREDEGPPPVGRG